MCAFLVEKAHSPGESNAFGCQIQLHVRKARRKHVLLTSPGSSIRLYGSSPEELAFEVFPEVTKNIQSEMTTLIWACTTSESGSSRCNALANEWVSWQVRGRKKSALISSRDDTALPAALWHRSPN